MTAPFTYPPGESRDRYDAPKCATCGYPLDGGRCIACEEYAARLGRPVPAPLATLRRYVSARPDESITEVRAAPADDWPCWPPELIRALYLAEIANAR